MTPSVADIRALEALKIDPEQVNLLADQVLVEPIEEIQQERFEAKTAGGLYIPQKPERNKKREFFRRGRVVLCGPGDRYGEGKVRKDGSRAAYAYPQYPDGRFPLNVKPGDLVLYERRAGCDVNLNGKIYVVLHEEQHLVAVIE